MTTAQRLYLRRKLDVLAIELEQMRLELAIDEEGAGEWDRTPLRLEERELKLRRRVAQATVAACRPGPGWG